ncbi:MAG: LysE family translocator [Burkholderiales bacterium]|nr:LysE family translocator [Burkholderiales bacterium]MCZ2134015.1 LysE family translocator [Burkholderiales bacterium]
MASHTLLLYLVAAFGLSLTPGPNSLLVLTHGALHGQRRTWFTVWGGALGFLLLIALSMAGIGALLKASAHALIVLKLIGGAYLIWLGIQLWRAPPVVLEDGSEHAPLTGRAMFRQGLLTAISNPKALLFYGAFLPQFIDASRELMPQFLTMATIFVAVEVFIEWLLALLAHHIRPWLRRAGRRFNQTCGGLFMAMGIALPMTR